MTRKIAGDDIENLLRHPTISVPDCGMKVFGLSRNGSYDAAKRGDFQTINLGKRIVVPTAPLRRMLGMDA
jgi:hypothetical protein